MDTKFYITTTAPYVNADPHIGFALEIIQADVVARYHKLLGENTLFGFGTDEHGLKIFRKAKENNLSPQEYCDKSVVRWNEMKSKFNLSYTNFIRTTDPKHVQAAQEMWQRCLKNGDIYKKTYKSKYCVGCELEKTDSELENGKCPIHPNTEIELIDEENYFFRFSKYQQPLLDFYEQNPQFVIPESKFNEIKIFVKSGLQDFSVSRLKNKMPWGVPVPDDPEQVMYVWFDALTFYISNLGWPTDEKNFADFWPGIQVAGKDNLRQQTAIWQAMLMSAGLPNSKQVFIHGFIISGGQKMSKSLGNTIDPFEYVKNYGTDALRYYLLSKISPTEDSDFTKEKFEQVYQSDLANGLGNLVARVAKLCENSAFEFPQKEKHNLIPTGELEKHIEVFQFNQALELLWTEITVLDQHVNQEKPWELKGNALKEVLSWLVEEIRGISYRLKPFLPETAEKIEEQFSGTKIKSAAPLFPRLHQLS